MRQVGIVMLVVPFVALFLAMGFTSGWPVACAIFGATTVTVAWIGVAVYLSAK